MGLVFDAEESPPLAPIRTTRIDAKPVAEEVSESTSNGSEECVTPKSEQPVCQLVLPPAPRKPRPAKRRKLRPPPKGYYPVPSDLASVFIPLPCPARRKIRVG
ncbi:hypothetical protein OPV22_007872 [Ensete ventricosum]|uniref:Uncharacterized protein n=1 Tax=Ensete ventricosum TaxID=4639 RepID=A0AAV8PN11_ENSVE|nr:hypothetical protein OPV22_007872 [Ensete ventricosum]